MLNSFHIFANAALGEGLSGSDRIFIEFSKRLSKKFKVFIHVWSEGYQMCLRQNLKEDKNINFCIISANNWCKLGFTICYFARIVLGIKDAFRLEILEQKSTVIYSASEFWMDSLPAFILKIRFPKIRWVAAWFQTAPNPLVGFTEGERKTTYKISAFYYWLMQLPIKPLIGKFADIVLVNNESEKNKFPGLNKRNKVLVMLGAVNILEINRYRKKWAKEEKIYDAVFQGRFHPQKGVVELIDIWKLVTNRFPEATLAMIGDGPLMDEVKKKIQDLGLNKNIELFGYVFDGVKKYDIFSKSKIVVHPAFYDSGGMASAEAMAFGLPAVGFNLDSYQSYYPRGMIKGKIGNLEEFADMILRLIKNEKERKEIGNQAREVVSKNWSWDTRVNRIIAALDNKISDK